jgi:hypothetical protein
LVDLACLRSLECRVGYFENALPYHTFCPNQIEYCEMLQMKD